MLSRVTRVTAISIEFHFAQSRKEVCRLQGALYTRLQSPNTFITLFGFYEANKQLILASFQHACPEQDCRLRPWASWWSLQQSQP